MGHLGTEELRRVQRGLVDHHGHALGLHALHDAPDGACAEIVGGALNRQAVHAQDQPFPALIDAVSLHLQHLGGHEVLAGAVGLHDGLDQVLRHVPVVGKQLQDCPRVGSGLRSLNLPKQAFFYLVAF